MFDALLFVPDLIFQFFEFLLHLDNYLPELVNTYGSLIYILLFLIIFCETGLVIAPFLPGDSLLFITGTIAGTGNLNLLILLPSIIAAAILGDSLNYFIGKFVGQKLLSMNLPMIRQESLDKTHEYYEKYGGLTIVIARFVPFVRTLAPFVAGLGKMKYRSFLFYNVIGGMAWVSIFLIAGFLLGSLPVVQDNMALIGILIVIISLVAAGTIIIDVIKFFFSYLFKKSAD